jgi:ribonucleoside-diphosphate reductase alpha chain
MTKFVTKRDGRKELFDVNKIKQVIQWAVVDLDVNPLVLESKFDEFIQDGISTDDIQQNIIYHSRILCSPTEPEWSVVAGRLQTMLRWKETQIFEKSFNYYIKEQIKNGIYKHPSISKWTKNEIIKLGEAIVQNRDLNHSYASVLTANKKYLSKNECIQQMFMVNAMIIASVETKENRLDIAKKIYDGLSTRKISLATPWLSNLRQNKNISSCFILQSNDDINSIFDNVKNSALISKNGGGIGLDLSKIRAKGSEINGAKNASKGVLSWSKIFNDVAVAVDQGGKRAGAITINIPIWHRDIEDFLTIQTENGDFREKSFDIFPQIALHDLFMKEVTKENGGIWHTFCPHEIKQVLGFDITELYGKDFASNYRKCITAYNNNKLNNVGVYNAKDFLKEIMKTQFETGLPYLTFIDQINEHNPNSHIGTIPCANLCTESYSVVKGDELAHTCNLASIVVGRIESNEEMIEMSKLCTRILDNGIQLTNPPIKESKKHNELFRTIGIGIQGLHDYVAKNNLHWKSYKKFQELAELIEFGAIQESIELAKERGKYPAFENSKWDTGEMITHFKKYSSGNVDWDSIETGLEKHGIRNSQLTSPAPNTSTSIFMDASAGIMPVYSGFYNEDNAVGKFSVFGMYIKENPLSYEATASRQNQDELTKVVSALQKFVDTGISAEYIFDHNKDGFSAKSLYDTIISAWKNKTKAIYYIRTIKKGNNIDDVIGIESVCSGCSG